jgi:hypothetical protein
VTLRSACMWLASVAAVACLTACQNGTLSISLPTSSPSHDSISQDSISQDSTSQDSTSQAATSPAGAPGSSGRPLLRVHDPRRVTGTITGHCTFRDHGQLPDPRCTPGAVDPNVTQANLRVTICRPGYTKTVRPSASVTSRFKYEVAYPAYGEPHSKKTELDHLVSLELGGANDAANLWPEYPPTPNPKDTVENALHAAVCDGRVKLTAAQNAIARNWETAEKVLGLS